MWMVHVLMCGPCAPALPHSWVRAPVLITATLHHWSVSGDTGGPGYPHKSRPEEELMKWRNKLKKKKHWNNSDYLRETFKKKSFIIKKRTLQKGRGFLYLGRVLSDNEIPRSLSQSQEARTKSQRTKSQSQEPDRVYRHTRFSKISSPESVLFKHVQYLQLGNCSERIN